MIGATGINRSLERFHYQEHTLVPTLSAYIIGTTPPHHNDSDDSDDKHASSTHASLTNNRRGKDLNVGSGGNFLVI